MAGPVAEAPSRTDHPQTVLYELEDLKPDPSNPRHHDGRNLAAIQHSLEVFGQVEPILVQKGTRRIIAGHGRLEGLRAAGHTEAWVVELDIDDVAAAALRDTLNRTAELATWDATRLLDEAKKYQDRFDMEALGWSDVDMKVLATQASAALDKATDDPHADAPEADLDRAEELLKKWQVERGQTWAIGEHRVVCGDSTNTATIAKLVGQESIRLVVTDPPYGVAYQRTLPTSEAITRHRRRDGMEIMNDNLGDEGTRGLVCDAFRAIPDNPGMAFYVFSPSGKMILAFLLGLQDAGMPARHQLVWLKDAFVMGRADYHYRHESILYGWNTDAAHYFVDERAHDSVLEFPRPKRSEQHPTMKPVGLVGRLIENSSQRGELVLDLFLGSGTTMVAAEQLGRKCYACELEPKFVAVVLERMEELTGTAGHLIAEGVNTDGAVDTPTDTSPKQQADVGVSPPASTKAK